jgi:GTPase SAR1 family protein
MYDITKRESFESLKKWIKTIRDNSDPDIIIYLVANKTDVCSGITEESSQSEEDSDTPQVIETPEFDEDATHNRLRFRSISRIPFTRTVNYETSYNTRQVSKEEGSRFKEEHNLSGFSEVSSNNRKEIKK